MIEKIIITLLIIIISLSAFAYNNDQAARYARRYTRLTNDYNEGHDPEHDIWWNVNPFIYEMEREQGASSEHAGYRDGADCAHFVSQCLQAGYIPMFENNYSDHNLFLGYLNCKNLHNLAKDTLAVREDDFHVTFKENFVLKERFVPIIETDHPYSGDYHFFIDLCDDVDSTSIHFDSLFTQPPNDIIYITDWYHWLPAAPLTFAGDQGCFWTEKIDSRHPYNEMVLDIWIELYDNHCTNDLFGFVADSLQWQAPIEPEDSYQKGDFQIFCKYRADSLYEDENFEIHYDNTYNNIGRMIRYKHAAICTDNSGADALVSAHNADHYNYSFDYYYPYAGSNSTTYYEVSDSWNKKPNLCAYEYWGNKSIITTDSLTSNTDIDTFAIGDPIYIKYAFKNDGEVMIPDRFNVKVKYEDTKVVLDTIFYNGIHSDSIFITSLDKYFTITDVESITINIELDAGDNSDYGDDWEATWNDQNWQETNESDNIISKTIYAENTLEPPTNVEIEVDTETDSISVGFDGDRQSNYLVYSSDNPYTGFEEDLTGTYSNNSWTAPLPDENRYYYVVETDERVDNITKTKIFKVKKRRK